MEYKNIDPSALKTEDKNVARHLASFPALDQNTKGEWFHYKNDWHYVDSEGYVLPLQNNKTMCECYQRFHTVVFLGASHQKYNRGCMLDLCRNPRLAFIKTTHVRDIPRRLPQLLRKMTKDNNTYAIILQVRIIHLASISQFSSVYLSCLDFFSQYKDSNLNAF